MLRALRRRLAVLFTLLAALVPTAALGLGFWMNWQQQQQTAQALFLQTAQSLCDRLAEAESVSDSWLAQQQQALGGVVDLWDNGSPTHFALQNRSRADTADLLTRAGKAAATAGTAAEGQPLSFTLQDSTGRSWLGVCAVVSRQEDRTLELTLLQPAPGPGAMLRTGLVFGGIWLAGLALLAVAGWLTAGRLLAPVHRAWQRQNEFIAAAGHELRSPLGVIKASLAAARSEETSPAGRQEFLRAAEREADRMAALTADLLVLAAGEAGFLTLHPAPTPPDTLCIEVYEQFYLLAREQNHPLTLHLPEEPLPPLYTDGSRLTQLLTILLQNALDHTPPGTPVELTLTRAGADRLRFTVTDHGPGVPDAQKEQVFLRFYRADESRSRKQNFGLGLSVARELARLLKAELTLTDTPGGGAAFAVELGSLKPEKS